MNEIVKTELWSRFGAKNAENGGCWLTELVLRNQKSEYEEQNRNKRELYI